MSKHLPKSENKHLKENDLSYLNQPLREEKTAHSMAAFSALSKFNLALTALALLFLLAGLIAPSGQLLGTVFYLLSFALGGLPAIIRSVEKLISLKLLEEDVTSSAAGLLLLFSGNFAAAACAVTLCSVLRLVWAYTEKRKKELSLQMRIALPEEVQLETEYGNDSCPPQKLAENDVIKVDVGETIAVDGVVLEGMSSLDASAFCIGMKDITVGIGSIVLSGCINTAAPLRVKVARIYEDSTAPRIAAMLDNSRKYKSSHEKLLSRISRVAAPILAAAALPIGLIPPLISGDWRHWLACSALFLLMSGTAALEQVVDFAYFAAVAESAKAGIIIKGTRFVEALARTKTMVFNKTGTVTDACYTVVDIVPQGMKENELLALAAAAEQFSSHPIASAICRADGGYGKQDGDKNLSREIPGRGVITLLGKKNVLVGNAAHLEENGVSCVIPKKGGLAIHVAADGKYCGYLLVTDKVKDGAFDAIEAIRHSGVKSTVLLTSDVRSVARPIASSLNFEMVKAELSEDGKVSAVEYLLATKAERSMLAFVGNRADDADALGRADVGISVNSLGSTAAMDAGDILVLSQDLRFVADAMNIAQRSYNAAGLAILISYAVKLFVLLSALTGLIGAAALIFVDFAATVFTYINSLRLSK